MGQYSPEEIGFLDEFSKDEHTLHRHRGWAKKGKRAVMRGAFVRGHRISGEGLLSLDGIVASTVVEGSMTRDKFLYFLEHSVVSFISIPFTTTAAYIFLLDAPHITISRKVEHSGDGQCLYSSWGGNFGDC